MFGHVVERRLPEEEFNRLTRDSLQWASRMTLDERNLLNQLMQLDGEQGRTLRLALMTAPAPAPVAASTTPPSVMVASAPPIDMSTPNSQPYAMVAAPAPPYAANSQPYAMVAATAPPPEMGSAPPGLQAADPVLDDVLNAGEEGMDPYSGLWTGIGYRDAHYSTGTWTRAVKCTICQRRAVGKRGIGEDPVWWLRQRGWWTPTCGKAPWSRAQCLQCHG